MPNPTLQELSNFETHKLLTRETCTCNKDGNRCPVCDHGLAVCAVCGAGEIELDQHSCESYLQFKANLSKKSTTFEKPPKPVAPEKPSEPVEDNATMEIKYDVIGYRRRREPQSEAIDTWIKSCINDGGIEEKIERMAGLISLIGEQWLIQNPERVSEVADVLECEHYDHKIVRNEK